MGVSSGGAVPLLARGLHMETKHTHNGYTAHDRRETALVLTLTLVLSVLYECTPACSSESCPCRPCTLQGKEGKNCHLRGFDSLKLNPVTFVVAGIYYHQFRSFGLHPFLLHNKVLKVSHRYVDTAELYGVKRFILETVKLPPYDRHGQRLLPANLLKTNWAREAAVGSTMT